MNIYILIGISIVCILYLFLDIDTLKVIFNPACWIQNHVYSKAWDMKLNELMETYTFKNNNGYHATLGNYEIWISNHPYASFLHNNVRPKRKTILRAYNKLQMDMYK